MPVSRWAPRSFAALALAFTVSAGVPAAAQPAAPRPPTAEPATAAFPECTREPSPADVQGAKGAHAAAAQYFEKGEYDKAIAYWRDAYNFDCTKPKLLQNVASAHQNKGDLPSAIDVLKLYLVRVPTAEDAGTVTEKIANLEKLIKDQASVPVASRATDAPPVAPAGPVSPPPPADEPGNGRSVAPWVVVGVGGAAVIVGAILLPVGLGAVSEAADHCTADRICERQEDIDDGNAGRVQATIGGIALGVGAAAVAGGLVWQFFFNEPKSVSATTGRARPATTGRARPGNGITAELVPVAGARTGGLLVRGAF